MKISENKFVSLTYDLTVDGKVVDKATAEKPLEFVYGAGMLLPEFEKHITGKEVGDSFEFTLTPAEGYGEVNSEAVVDLPKEIFMVDGALAEDLLIVGNTLPMGDNMGNRLMGTIKEVGAETVKMDFNHPMAGKTLFFKGDIVGLREATEADMMNMGGGCGCEGDCSSDCECGSDCECNEDNSGSCGCGN